MAGLRVCAGCCPAERRIYLIRGQKVMLDTDLAELYQVQSFRLNEQVTRNRHRFPPDFMFQLTKEETRSLTSQFRRSKQGSNGNTMPSGQRRTRSAQST